MKLFKKNIENYKMMINLSLKDTFSSSYKKTSTGD